MKFRIILIIFLAYAGQLKAQTYNNEWINYTQTYFKFKVGHSGAFKIYQHTLADLGIGTANADHYQIWRNGKQVPLFTSNTGEPLTNHSGYIEFWVEKNDGIPDSVLYRKPEYQLSNRLNMFTDTVTLFLSVNSAITNLRITQTNNDVAGNTLLPDPYFLHHINFEYREQINRGIYLDFPDGSWAFSPSYDWGGEGFTSLYLTNAETKTHNLTDLNVYTGGNAPAAKLDIAAVGNRYVDRRYVVKVSGDSVYGKSLNNFDSDIPSINVPLNKLTTANPAISITNAGTVISDRLALVYTRLTYPRTFRFDGGPNFKFELPANVQGNFLEIERFNFDGAQPVIYDLTNNKRYIAEGNFPGTIKVKLLPSVAPRQLVAFSSSPVNVIELKNTDFTTRNFTNYSQTANQADYAIISHKLLNNSSGGSNPVEEYRTYRSSATGGGYNAKSINIDELEDQFAFGINKHPLSVKNFLRYSRAKFASPIKSVFLIGRGVDYWEKSRLPNPDDINVVHVTDLVPTFGYPGSDELLASEHGLSQPLTPIGRLSAIYKYEVADYLEKVKSYEQALNNNSPEPADKKWHKNVVHVAGGSDQGLSNTLINALSTGKRIIEDSAYGAKVYNFHKETASATESLNSTELNGLFKEGIGLLTYFGHSSANTFDYNLDYPENYDNTGKYPVFNVMGCNAGNFFTFNRNRLFDKETLSERYVLAKQKGVIAFLAASGLGVVSYLENYYNNFYNTLSKSHYGKTLGEIKLETIKKILLFSPETGANADSRPSLLTRMQCEHFLLHGDPALKLYNQPKPDFAISAQDIIIEPQNVSIGDAKFAVKSRFYNLGKSVNGMLTIEVKRTFPDLTSEIVIKDTIIAPYNNDSLTYEFVVDGSRHTGLNKLEFKLDAINAYDEVYETNNIAIKEIYIIEDNARPVYPYNYSIINTSSVKLVASTDNAFALPKEYRFEMDTTNLFNSAVRQVYTVTAPGGIIEYTPPVTLQDGRVYYWRVGTKGTDNNYLWNNASFVYLSADGTGYNMSHIHQMLYNNLDRLQLDSFTQKYTQDKKVNLFIRSGVFPIAAPTATGFSISLDDDMFTKSPCGISNIVVNVFDPKTGKPWYNSSSEVGQQPQYDSDPICGGGREHNFQYSIMSQAKRKSLSDFLDIIPDGYYVTIRNSSGPLYTDNTYAADWKNDATALGAGNTFYEKLKTQGFTTIDSFNRPRVFVFVYQKNRPAFVPKTIFSEGISDPITLSAYIDVKDSVGYITSPLLGPAKKWKTLHWRGSSLDNPSFDKASVTVMGVNANGVETVLYNTLVQQDFDLSAVNAVNYPYIRLKLTTEDEANYTPYQLSYWRINADMLPEGAVAPNLITNVTYKDTIDAGAPYVLSIPFKNIGPANFDSVAYKFTVRNGNSVEQVLMQGKKKPLIINDTLMLQIPVNTKNILPGKNTFTVTFNPDYQQPEQHLFNNYIFKQLYVKGDNTHPLMDVTFDGIHILNNDIVSAKPNIVIKIKDEAEYLLLNDTSIVSVQLRYPDNTLRSVYFKNNDTLRLIPATSSNNNEASIEFTPYLLEDGIYELIVTGKDMSGNTAGTAAYRVSFMVNNKPMLSNLMNYPNPFTTSTAFVFTLTGVEIPQQLRIQILTVTGKVVKEINKEELGPINIGRNITEYKWDGTDQYGQKLANGVYLYRVITNLNGKALDKYMISNDNKTDITDKFFNKGYGKMYLMR